MEDYTNIRVIIRSAYFTDHKTGVTALAVEVEATDMDGVWDNSKPDTASYAKIWLTSVNRMLRTGIIPTYEDRNVDLILVASQKEYVKMSEKVIRLYNKVVNTNASRKKIDSVVAAANHYHNNPTDVSYADIVETLLECKKVFKHFSVDAQWHSSPKTERVFQLAKAMVAPDVKVQPIRKRVKSNKAASLPAII